MRAAGPADHAALEAVLRAHAEQAMFPLTNLRDHGLADARFASDNPHAMRFWIAATGVLGLNRGGIIMPVMPQGVDARAVAAVLRGASVSGAIGPAAQVRPILAALGLVGRPAQIDRDEPQFRLDLAALVEPETTSARLCKLDSSHQSVMREWRRDYLVETVGYTVHDAADRADSEVPMLIAEGLHRILLIDGEPVATCGFNAALPGIVQLGGVYTPPALRGRGHARRAVALHLAQARAQGVTRAVLNVASDSAGKAYRAIGFQTAGETSVVIFRDRVQIT